MAQLQATQVTGNVSVYSGELIEAGGALGAALKYGQSYVIPGTVDDGPAPAIFVSVGTNEVKQIVGAKFVTTTGTADVDLQVNGSSVTTVTAGTTVDDVTGLTQALADGDTVQLVISNSNAENLSFTIYVEATTDTSGGQPTVMPYTNGTVKYGQSYVIPGAIAAGDTIPSFFVGESTTESKQIVGARHVCQTGDCTLSLSQNGTAVGAPYDAINVTTTAASINGSVDVNDGDQLQLSVDASNGAEDVTVTIYLETQAA